MGYHIKMSEAAKDFIAEKGYDIQFGARPLKRAIQKYLEDPMAEVIIKSNMKEGDTIAISFNKKKEEVVMKVIHADEESAGGYWSMIRKKRNNSQSFSTSPYRSNSSAPVIRTS